MAFYQQNNAGLAAWLDNGADNFFVAKGSTQAEAEGSGLEVVRFDPLNPGTPLEKVGRFDSAIGFNCLHWGNVSAEVPQGIITGGLKDGSLALFDAAKIIGDSQGQTTQAEDAIIASFELYPNADFFCMEYNPFKPTLLATGGHDIFIVNFEKGYTEPEIIIPHASQGASAAAITAIAWNKSKMVQHILASAQENGRINIFDLKLKKNIFSFSDGNEGNTGRKVGIAWNPSVATQIAVAFDDPESGVQVWDLRNNKGPVKKIASELVRNVHSIAWSTTHKSTILLASKEGEFFEYNLETDSFEQTLRPGFDTLYARYAGLKDTIYAVSSEGALLIHSKNTQALQQAALKQYPAHLKAKTQVTAGLTGNGLVNFKGEADAGVYFYRTPAESSVPSLHKKMFEQFERVIFDSAGSAEKLSQKLSKGGKHDKQLVSLINVLDHSPEEKLAVLDIDVESLSRNTEKITGKSYLKVEKAPKEKVDLAKKLGEINEDEAVNFFSDLGKQEEEPEEEPAPVADHPFDEPQGDDTETISTRRNHNWNRGIESLIRKNLFYHNYEAAIDLALKADRVFEAFLIAGASHNKKDQLYRYVLERYEDTEGFVKDTLTPVSTRNYEAILSAYSTDQWKDILAFIVKGIAPGAEQANHFGKLLARLKADPKASKILQYVTLIAGKTEAFVESLFAEDSRRAPDLPTIIGRFELLYLLKLKVDFSFDNPALEGRLVNLVLQLVETGHVHLAYEVLNKFGNPKSEKIKSLQVLLFHTFSEVVQPFYYPPQDIKKQEFIFPKKKVVKQPAKPVEAAANVPRANPFGAATGLPKPLGKPDLAPKPEEPKKGVKPAVVPPKAPTPIFDKPLPNAPELEHNRSTQAPNKPQNLPPKFQQHQAFEEPKHEPTRNVPRPPMPAPVPTPSFKPVAPAPVPPRANPGTPTPSRTEITSPAPFSGYQTVAPPPRPNPAPPSQPPQSSKPAPPPANNRPPPPQAPSIKYDPAKVASVSDFISKTPDVLGAIDTNPTRANQMYETLVHFNGLIDARALDLHTFDRFAHIIHLIEENRIPEASSAVREVSQGLRVDLQATWQVFDRIVKYLL